MKIGDKVRTTDPLTADFGVMANDSRQAGADGEVVSVHTDVGTHAAREPFAMVKHSNGACVPYRLRDELTLLPSKAAARVYPNERVSDSDLAELLVIEERARVVGLTSAELTAYNLRLAGCARGLLIEGGEARTKARAAVEAWDSGVVNQSTAAAFDALREVSS